MEVEGQRALHAVKKEQMFSYRPKNWHHFSIPCSPKSSVQLLHNDLSSVKAAD